MEYEREQIASNEAHRLSRLIKVTLDMLALKFKLHQYKPPIRAIYLV